LYTFSGSDVQTAEDSVQRIGGWKRGGHGSRSGDPASDPGPYTTQIEVQLDTAAAATDALCCRTASLTARSL
jgi:hypothetical protein